MNNNELAHHGILGMKWGVRRSQQQLDRLAGRTWTKTPDGGVSQIGRQVKLTQSKSKYKDLVGRKQKKIAKIDINRQKKDLKKAWKEYDTFSKDMHKKVGKTNKIKVSKNEQGTKTYTNKKNKTFKEFEVRGAQEYELNRGAKIASIYANTAAIAAGSMFIASIIKR